MDYQKELDMHPEYDDSAKQDLQKLASLQKDIAISDSAEDFIRHPFFKSFEIHMNEMISDSKNKIMAIESLEELKAHKASIAAIVELKSWLNKHVMAGRYARQAINQFEDDSDDMNRRIQAAVDKSVITE